jgi:chromosome segregation ATPase
MASNTSSPADEIRARNATLLANIQTAVTAQSDASQNVTYLLSQIRDVLQTQEGAELQALNIRTAQTGDSKTSALTATFDQATTARNLQIAELGNVYANISTYSNAPNADVVKLGDLAGTGPTSIEGLSNAVDGAAAALLVHERMLIVAQRERAHRLRDARDESDIDLAQGRQIIKRFAADGAMSDQDAKNIAAELQAQVVNTTRQLDVITALIPTPGTPSMFDRVSNEAENGDNNNIRRRMADRLEDIKEELRAAILALQDAVFSNLPVNATANAAVAAQLLDANKGPSDAQTAIDNLRVTNKIMEARIVELESQGSGGTGGSDPECEENLKQARARIDFLHQMCLRLRRERDNALQQIKTRQRGIKQLKEDLKKVQKKVNKGDKDSAKKDLDDCNEQVKRLEAELEQAKKNNTNSPDMQKEIDSLKLTNTQYEREVEKLRDQVKSLEDQIAKMSDDGSGMDDCEKMLRGVRADLAKEIKEHKELLTFSDNLRTMNNDLSKTIATLEAEIVALKEELKAKPKEGLSDCEKQLLILRELLDANKISLEENETEIKELSDEKAAFLSQQQSDADQIKDLKDLIAKNPQDGLKDCQDRVEALQEEIKQLTATIDDLKADLKAEQEDNPLNNEESIAKLNKLKNEHTELSKRVELLEFTREDLRGKYAGKEAEIDVLERAATANRKEIKQLNEVIDALKKEAETVVGSPDQLLKLQQEKQRLEERLADCQRLGEVNKTQIEKLKKKIKQLQEIINNYQDSDEDEDLAKLKEELEGLRKGADDGQNYIEHLDEVIADRNDRIALLNGRVDRRGASIEQLNTAIDAYKEAEDSSTANEANIASLEVQAEQLAEANAAIETEVESLLGDHEGDHPLTIAIRSRNTAFIEGTQRIARTKKIRDDLKAKLAACKSTSTSQ